MSAGRAPNLDTSVLHAKRFDGIVRPYSKADVERLRGSFKVEHTVAMLGASSLAAQAAGEKIAIVTPYLAQPGTQFYVEAFQANVAKTMAGGWSAGGAVPPKLALLDIGSGNLVTTTTTPNATCPNAVTSNRGCVQTGSTYTCLDNARNAEPVMR